MILTIASGKGGTGKTTVAVNLAMAVARSGRAVQLLDADVEAPNAHLFLHPQIHRSVPVSLLVPEIDESLCNLCDRCRQVCEYHAIGVFGSRVVVFPELCHGCGGCTLACPQAAINETEHRIGEIGVGRAMGIDFVMGQLTIGEAKATPIIHRLKTQVQPDGVNIIDAPPGTSSPVVEAIRGADDVLLVTEPTPFGLNDLVLAVEVVRKLERPFAVVINRADIGDERVARYCREQEIDILAEIPEDRRIVAAYAEGKLLLDVVPGFYEKMLLLWQSVENRQAMKMGSQPKK